MLEPPFERSRYARFWRCCAKSEADRERNCFRCQRPTFECKHCRGAFSTESARSSHPKP